jgi:hypothetical protein
MIDVVPDTFPPNIIRISPADGATRFEGTNNFRVEFSERMAPEGLLGSSFSLVPQGGGTPILPSAASPSNRDKAVDLVFESLGIGEYEFHIDPDALEDLAGNALGGAARRTELTVAERRDPGDTFATALDLGRLVDVATYSDTLAARTNPIDVYSFTLDTARAVEIRATGMNDWVTIRMYRDLNVNGQADANERYLSASSPTNAVAGDVFLPGTYYVVVSVSGTTSTPYTLTVTPGAEVARESIRPGDTFSTATDLGDLTSANSRTDMLMSGVESTHVYKFELLTPRSVEVRATGMNDWVTVRLYRDLNVNGQADANERYLSASSPTNAVAGDVFLPGTYFVVVSVSGTTSTPYTLTVTPGAEVARESIRPGDTFSTATDLGDLTSANSRTDMLMSGVESTHVYKFELLTPRSVEVRATGMNDWVTVRLYRDLNVNGQADANERYLSASSPTNAVAGDVFLPGTYFVVVSVSGTTSTPYTLTVTPGAEVARESIRPGDTFSTATDLGDLTSANSRTDMLMSGVESTHVYKFELLTPRSVEVRATGMNDWVTVRLYRDLNVNGQADANERYLSSSSPTNAVAGDVFLPGTYFVVVSVSGTTSTPYTLTVTPGAEVPVLPIDPGPAPETAHNLGLLSAQPITVSDMLMRGVDDVDYFRFQNDSVGSVTIRVTESTGFLRLRVIQNGVVVASRSGASAPSIELQLELSEYFIVLDQAQNTRYRLSVSRN